MRVGILLAVSRGPDGVEAVVRKGEEVVSKVQTSLEVGFCCIFLPAGMEHDFEISTDLEHGAQVRVGGFLEVRARRTGAGSGVFRAALAYHWPPPPIERRYFDRPIEERRREDRRRMVWLLKHWLVEDPDGEDSKIFRARLAELQDEGREALELEWSLASRGRAPR